jgi:hypothetical protein
LHNEFISAFIEICLISWKHAIYFVRVRRFIVSLLIPAALACNNTESDNAENVSANNPPATMPPGNNPPPPDVSTSCDAASQEPVRRLSAFEYTRALNDLIGFSPEETTLPATSVGTVFAREEAALGSSALLVSGQFAASEAAASAVRAKLESNGSEEFIGCDISNATCIDTFIDVFGKKTFRRPVEDGEHQRLRALYDEVVLSEGVNPAIAALVQAMILSPRFGFHVEDQSENGEIDSWSIASRMSFFLWSSAPDEELFAAAGSNTLFDPKVREEQALRMLKEPKARESVVRFYRELLDLDILDALAPLPASYPEWTETLRTEISAETDRFVEATVFEQDGSPKDLLTSRWVEAGPELSTLYGIAGGHNELPAERAGLLTRAGFLASKSHAVQPSPVFRGLTVLDRFICRDIAPPPPDIPDVATDVETVTNRERYAAHTADPACAGCHGQIDPIGFSLENFDAIGGFRTHDNGQAVDATATVFEQSINGGAELSTVLANSDEVAQCGLTQWIRFARGHSLNTEERCARSIIMTHFSEGNGTVKDLLIAIVGSELFIQ